MSSNKPDTRPTCETCRWWRKYQKVNAGDCDAADHSWFKAVMYFADGQGDEYDASMRTYSDFGCNQHEPKEGGK